MVRRFLCTFMPMALLREAVTAQLVRRVYRFVMAPNVWSGLDRTLVIVFARVGIATLSSTTRVLQHVA